ncbi:MAG: hypothetical protein OEO20_04170 [Gemmatimonadota bacterium]|nr:hypothetical protein [Gemmatimonadota bacterium]MDH3367427.1 hypothetical protein [Gemmatimonadota bacterium]MDH3477482.1 hypothetical protein [Gemmatimonadota bacterium]MDH5548700.1 hypothetical protein [Gemmatimonadota bacterium]
MSRLDGKWRARGTAVALCLAFAPASQAGAQDRPPTQMPPDSARIVAGERYSAGGTRRFFFGKLYRDLWTTPLMVEVLDLGREGGGLTPTTAGGGFQTKSLRFRGADGYDYGFRSVDKDPDVLPPELEGTVVEDIVQDQMSSQHPAGPAVVAPLLEAAGLLHTTPRLVVLPDDPRLGEFRERFAGTLGFFERRATVAGAEPFAGADEIIDGYEMIDRARESPGQRVDVATLLRARLFDLLIGDWDRHRGQWNFVRRGTDADTLWVPLPEDRDQAFVQFDGLLLGFARQYAPQLINFGDDLPSVLGWGWNGREVDRRFLVGVERSVYDSTAAELARRMTDSVIDASVRALPAEYYAMDGPRLAWALRRRRDRLPEGAGNYYRLLAGEVDIHGTDVAETVVVDRHADGQSDVALYAGDVGDTPSSPPYYRRQFHTSETNELRIYLYRGRDRVIVTGTGGIPLHIVVEGEAEVANRSDGGGVRLYTTGPAQATGRVHVDRRSYAPPPKRFPTELPPRDWGHRWRSLVWAGFGPDVGLFVGGGATVIDYGFRKLPYASRVAFRGGFSTGALTGRAEFSGEVYRLNSRVRGRLDVALSGIEVLRYNGLGNELQLTQPEDYYRVRQQLVSVEPAAVLPLGAKTTLTVGPTLTFSRTSEQQGRILTDLDLYGEDGFGQVGVRGQVDLDTRDVTAAATRGVRVTVGGSFYPSVWDVEESFGEAHGEASTYLSPPGFPLRPTLALRAGGKKVWGRFPFQEAAFIGDQRSVRLGRQNRYAGEAAAYGNAELRFDIGSVFLVLPARFGIFGLGDLGRVFVDGEDSSTWHWAAGGGLWIAFLQSANTLSVALAKSEDRVGVYATAGFAF